MIPDSIIDTDISVVERYMEEDAWEKLQQFGKVIIKCMYIIS